MRLEKPISLFKFIKEMDKAIEQLEMKPDLAHRFLNDGFSGGEKKRNEIVQMMMLKPAIAMLDEIDSGLDVDALRIVSDAINQCQQQTSSYLTMRFYEYFSQQQTDLVMLLVELTRMDEWIEKRVPRNRK